MGALLGLAVVLVLQARCRRGQHDDGSAADVTNGTSTGRRVRRKTGLDPDELVPQVQESGNLAVDRGARVRWTS